MTLYVLGIDPGVNGALSVVSDEDFVATWDIPTLTEGKRKTIDYAQLGSLFDRARLDYDPAAACIELVHSMPKQGVASTFTFGKAVGALEYAIYRLRCPVFYHRPAAWKKALGLGAGKDAARAKCVQLMPASAPFVARVKDEHRAEAALMAYLTMKGLL